MPETIFLATPTAPAERAPAPLTAKLSSFFWKPIHLCFGCVLFFVSIYSTLVVVAEWTFWVLVKKIFGIGLSHAERDEQNQLAYVNKCIEGSLRSRDYESVCKSVCRKKNDNDDDGGGCEDCCPICFEEFSPRDDLVSGVDDCCKNNVFHRDCITQWLRVGNSCPCCRRSMVIDAVDEEYEERRSGYERLRRQTPATLDSYGNHRHDIRWFRSEFIKRIETAKRMRNELLYN